MLERWRMDIPWGVLAIMLLFWIALCMALGTILLYALRGAPAGFISVLWIGIPITIYIACVRSCVKESRQIYDNGQLLMERALRLKADAREAEKRQKEEDARIETETKTKASLGSQQRRKRIVRRRNKNNTSDEKG